MFSRVKISLLFIWSAFLVWFIVSGKSAEYLHPDYHLLPVIAAVLLLLMSFIWLVQIILKNLNKKTFIPFYNESSKASKIFLLIIFIYPILLNFIVNPEGLTSNDLAIRGDDFISSYVEFYPSSNYKPRLTEENKDEYVSMDLVEICNEAYLNPSKTHGRKVKIFGFLYQGGNERYVYNISRFLVVCCLADAIPHAISVDPVYSRHLPEDTWIEVEGETVVDSVNKKVYLKMHEFQLIDTPEEQYLYLK